MHDCSTCGQACYCHGDIDDCQVETEEYAYMMCDGCGGCDQFMDGDGEHWDEGDWMDDYGTPADDGSLEAEWDWIVRAHDEHIARA